MNGLLKAILTAALLTPAAFAEESTDVSLAREVDQYLEHRIGSSTRFLRLTGRV